MKNGLEVAKPPPSIEGFETLKREIGLDLQKNFPQLTVYERQRVERVVIDAMARAFIEGVNFSGYANGADLASISVEDLEAYMLDLQERRRKNSRDSKTTLFSREDFENSLAVFMSDRRHIRLLVLTIDIVNFKWINDHFGQSIGDMVISRFGYMLKNQVRGTRDMDHISRCRDGGDEFRIAALVNSWESSIQIIRRLIQSSLALDISDIDTRLADFKCRIYIGGICCKLGPRKKEHTFGQIVLSGATSQTERAVLINPFTNRLIMESDTQMVSSKTRFKSARNPGLIPAAFLRRASIEYGEFREKGVEMISPHRLLK